MNIYKYSRSTHIRFLCQKLKSGFTIVELIVVISIIGILASISIISYGNWQQSVIEAQLKSDLNSVATAMESYRNFNNGYPSSIPSTFSPSEGVILSGGSIDGGKTYCVDIFSSKVTDLYYYIDSESGTVGAQLGTCGPTNLLASFDSAFSANLTWNLVDGATSYTLQRDVDSKFLNAVTLTTQTGNSFISDGLSSATTYYYRLKMNIHGLDSAWSNSAVYTTMVPPAAPAAPTIAVSLVVGDVLAVITPVAACAEGILQYGINNRINDGIWSGWTSWSESIPTASQVANDGVKYGYQARTRCYLDPIYSMTSTSAEASYTDPINVPAVPTVAVSTVVDTTTFSWGEATCISSGNIARYQYRYTISPSGYDSGLVATASNSVAFTTSTEGQTYTVQVQAECYSVSTASGMSSAGSGSYYHPITQYDLTIIAGTGGTVNASGTYDTGTVRTITATPNSYYSFSSWSGSTGCSGVASHTITVDANKTCTANFTITAVAVPSVPTVTPSTVGATTTFSWSAATCTGNTARYQYRYTISPSGYDSGLVATASTSVAFTTSTQGQTYTVQVQAECYNTVAASGMSTAGSGSYYRIITYTLTLAAGTGGTVNASGTYNENTVQTITATPSANYSFTSWTGSTGCSGVASHTITMDANKSCTANFTIITYTLTIAAGANGTVNTGGNYNSGTSQTITATPSGYYKFSSWTGSTGCSGVASHTITMDANKSCTANFYLPTYTLTVNKYGGDAWVWCGNENAACTYGGPYEGTGPIKYGADTRWIQINYAKPTGVVGIPCTSANFGGDPASGTAKMCFFWGSSAASSGGTYNAGTTVTISATPSVYVSYWNGSTGCSGAASHNIVMNENKTCSVWFAPEY